MIQIVPRSALIIPRKASAGNPGAEPAAVTAISLPADLPANGRLPMPCRNSSMPSLQYTQQKICRLCFLLQIQPSSLKPEGCISRFLYTYFILP